MLTCWEESIRRYVSLEMYLFLFNAQVIKERHCVMFVLKKCSQEVTGNFTCNQGSNYWEKSDVHFFRESMP